MTKILEVLRTILDGLVEGRARRAQANLDYRCRNRSWE